MVDVEALKKEGWFVDTLKLKETDASEICEPKKLINELMNWDIKKFGAAAISECLDKKKSEFAGPLVLQLANWRNVSRPKIPEHSENDGVCKLALSDGFSTVSGLQIDSPLSISGNTPYGTKVLLSGVIPYECGHLILNGKNCKVLGGKVEKLIERWKISKLGAIVGKKVEKDASYTKFQPFVNNSKILSVTKAVNKLDINKEVKDDLQPNKAKNTRDEVASSLKKSDQKKQPRGLGVTNSGREPRGNSTSGKNAPKVSNRRENDDVGGSSQSRNRSNNKVPPNSARNAAPRNERRVEEEQSGSARDRTSSRNYGGKNSKEKFVARENTSDRGVGNWTGPPGYDDGNVRSLGGRRNSPIRHDHSNNPQRGAPTRGGGGAPSNSRRAANFASSDVPNFAPRQSYNNAPSQFTQPSPAVLMSGGIQPLPGVYGAGNFSQPPPPQFFNAPPPGFSAMNVGYSPLNSTAVAGNMMYDGPPPPPQLQHFGAPGQQYGNAGGGGPPNRRGGRVFYRGRN